MPDDTCTPQAARGSEAAPEAAWMVHAETQTCAISQSPVWADEQFSFLELQPLQDSATDASVLPFQHLAWSKVWPQCLVDNPPAHTHTHPPHPPPPAQVSSLRPPPLQTHLPSCLPWQALFTAGHISRQSSCQDH